MLRAMNHELDSGGLSSRDQAAADSAALCRLNYRPDVSPAEIAQAHRDWARRHAAPLYPTRPNGRTADPERPADAPLRVGYVSGDLRRHPVALFVEPILRCHDRAQIQPLCYDSGGERDDLNDHLRSLVPDWRDAAAWSDQQLFERILADRIDILVDLAGHTPRNRLLVFARRAAPVQVTAIGYVATTGLETMDYRLTDLVCDPPETQGDNHYSETLWRLGPGFNCYAPPRGLPDPGPAPCLGGTGVTFGSLNNLDKISDQVLDIWASILRALPSARLIMKTKGLGEPAIRERLLARFAAGGIETGRLELLDWSATLAEHFEIYRRIDIALDPFPYNGTTTTCESLIMGVPMIALRGDRHAARVSASILARLGLEGLSAPDAPGYIGRALGLASRPDAIAKLRQGLRRRVVTSPLCDAAGYTRSLDAAYREMWETHQQAAAA